MSSGNKRLNILKEQFCLSIWNFLFPVGTKELPPFSSVFIAVFGYVFVNWDIRTLIKAAFQRRKLFQGKICKWQFKTCEKLLKRQILAFHQYFSWKFYSTIKRKSQILLNDVIYRGSLLEVLFWKQSNNQQNCDFNYVIAILMISRFCVNFLP